MDAYDIFKQLTRGVVFTKQKKTPKKELPEDYKEKHANTTENIILEKLDKEVDSCEDNESSFQLLTDKSSNNSPKKKGKKKPSPKQEMELAEEARIKNIRKAKKISVIGKQIPQPIEKFDQLESEYKILPCLLDNLKEFNYTEPTPIQMQALPIMLKGRSLMACAPTGSGKTIAFLIPIITDLRAPKKSGFRAIVLAPTRELAQQIYRVCIFLSQKTALKIHLINKTNLADVKFGPKSNKKFDILISTPNRIKYLLEQEPPILDLSGIEWFIIDEADKLMEAGQNNFKEQLDVILAACTNPAKKLALFSATYTVPVAKWAIRHLKGLIRVTVGQQNSATELVEQELLFVGSENGKLIAIRDLVRSGLKPPVLIFVQSRDRAKQLFNELLYDGINVDVIHADRTQKQRDNCVRAFREGNIWVLICTELMSRGIDFKGVNLVINYDFPPSKISYIHRIGRSGRAGTRGRAITFFTQNDIPHIRSIAEIIRNSGGNVPDFMLKLKNARKSDRKKLAKSAPKREDITTAVKSDSKIGMCVKRHPSIEDINIPEKKKSRKVIPIAQKKRKKMNL